MENDFLNSLYIEEEAIYNKIIADPLYNELIEIQRFIIRRGGIPRQAIGIKSLPVQQTLFPAREEYNIETKSDYDTKWVWQEKTEYAFRKLGGKASPREVVSLLIKLEKAIPGKNKISENVYNVISKLKKTNDLIKDESVKDKTVYSLRREESFRDFIK
jgi:hypothetical protein